MVIKIENIHLEEIIRIFQKDLLHLQFNSKIMFLDVFYKSYFPFNKQNCTHSSKSNRNDKEFEYDFLTICRYFNHLKIRG